jgi:hypothetical protein
MDTDAKRNEDLLRLNALVDGELAPDEHAALAARIAADRDYARAYTTLARLKAAVSESVMTDMMTDVLALPELPVRRSRRFGAVAAVLAVIAVGAAALLVVLNADDAPVRIAVPPGAHQAAIRLAALPSDPIIPDLAVTGILLADVAVEQADGARTLTATYRGPRGCRLELRVRPAGTAARDHGGTLRHRWTVGALAYDLVAYGMPGWRFAIIADLAEQQSRDGGNSTSDTSRFADARTGAPPCTG